jgi:NAD(P)-dependent dehydrogenase (short-subunit alcohol dehydrogenase family)
LFASEGAQVVCADINLEAAQKTVARITQEIGNSDNALAVHADVGKEADIKALVDTAIQKFGK